MTGEIGVCSWSLRPASPADLVEKIRATGCNAVQLALDPIRLGFWNEDETFERLGEAGIRVPGAMMAMKGEDYTSIDSIARTGGVRPDETWPANAEAASELAEIAGRHGIGLITFHAGFLPHDPKDPERRRMLERLRELAAAFFDTGTRIGLETGQEDADTLLGVLEDLGGRGAGVNFDPANMLLYGSGDPIEAFGRLAPHVVQVHIKDARPSPVEGVWGEETPPGEGAVNWDAFFAILRDRLPGVGMMIERESGDDRVGDIRKGRELVERYTAGRIRR